MGGEHWERQAGRETDGASLGKQIMLHSLEAGSGVQPGLGKVLALRMQGVADDGQMVTFTVGVPEEHVDGVLVAFQQGVQWFKSEQ